MKSEELKQVLKPLVKQCIKEVIFEDGVLSGIITEKGIAKAPFEESIKSLIDKKD